MYYTYSEIFIQIICFFQINVQNNQILYLFPKVTHFQTSKQMRHQFN